MRMIYLAIVGMILVLSGCGPAPISVPETYDQVIKQIGKHNSYAILKAPLEGFRYKNGVCAHDGYGVNNSQNIWIKSIYNGTCRNMIRELLNMKPILEDDKND